MCGEALSAREVTRVGRIAVVGLVVLTLLWIPVIDASNRSLFIVASEIINHLGPSITAVFACGIFLRRVNSEGAVIGLSIGSLVGAIRLIFFLVFQDTCDQQVHPDNRQVCPLCRRLLDIDAVDVDLGKLLLLSELSLRQSNTVCIDCWVGHRSESLLSSAFGRSNRRPRHFLAVADSGGAAIESATLYTTRVHDRRRAQYKVRLSQ